MTRVCALLTIVALSAAFAGVASASCNPHNNDSARTNNGHSYQDGWVVGPDYGEACLNGSYANIRVKAPYTLTGDTSAWTMISGTPGPSNNLWAQIGWIEVYSGLLKHFVQYNTPDTSYPITVYPTAVPEPSVGDNPQYKVTFGSGVLKFFINYSTVETFDTTFSGCYADQAGEIFSLADQMPGEVNTHETFTTPEDRDRATNTWNLSRNWTTYALDQSTIPSSDASKYFGNVASGMPYTEDDIWDKDCTG